MLFDRFVNVFVGNQIVLETPRGPKGGGPLLPDIVVIVASRVGRFGQWHGHVAFAADVDTFFTTIRGCRTHTVSIPFVGCIDLTSNHTVATS